MSAFGRLRRNGPLGRLLLGEFISSFGDAIYLVAFVVVVFRESRDPVVLGIVAAARQVPFALLSIPAGFIVDRFDRRLVLLASDLAKAGCMLVLAWLVAAGGGVWAIAALAVLSAVMSTVFWPAIWALIPNLVPDERDHGVANSAWATLDNIAWVAGPVVAALLLLLAEPWVPFALNAVTFVLMAAILWTLPPNRPAAAAKVTAGPRAAEGGGGAARIEARGVAGIIVIGVVAAFGIAGINILTVVLSVDVFRAGDEVTGYLNAAVGLGGTVGAVASARIVTRPRLTGALLVAAAAMGLAVMGLGLATSVVIGFVAIAAASVANLVLEVLRTTILQRLVPDSHRGRVTGLLMSCVMGAEVAGTLVVPALVAVSSAGVALAGTGAIVVAGGALAALLIGRAGDARPGGALPEELAEPERPASTVPLRS